MACLGVHFALSPTDLEALLAAPDDAARLAFVHERIEERYLDDESLHAAQTDKAWDAIHRALTDGRLAYDNGTFPLSHVILGGQPLYGEDDYIITLKTADEVAAVASALEQLTKDQLRTGYNAIDEQQYGFPKSIEDFEYTWDWLTELVPFYRRAALAGRAVIFTADQ